MRQLGVIFYVRKEDHLRLTFLKSYAARVGKNVCQCTRCEDFFITPTPCDRCPDCGDSKGVAAARNYRAEKSEIEYNGG